MADSQSSIFQESPKQIMERLGVDTSWYDRVRARSPLKSSSGIIPLNDSKCGMISIYYVDKNGQMFTTDSVGEKYDKVREVGSRNTTAHFLCVCCGEQFEEYGIAREHYKKY